MASPMSSLVPYSRGCRSCSPNTAKNPTRADRREGSFKINLKTGAWGDFATSERGGDLVALAAYLFSISQVEAATRIAAMLGINPYVR